MALFTLIPFLPLLACIMLVAGGHRWGPYGHRLAIPAIGVSCALSVGAFLEIVRQGPFSIALYQLFQSGQLVVEIGLYVDQLTVLLLLLVTGVSTVVHVFSARYMIGDPRYNRFFAVTTLLTFSMVMLVMSRNLLMVYIFWEIMGLCSYLLISHWAERPPAIQAATKVFLVNAIADGGLGVAILLSYITFGTLDIPTILSQAESMQDRTINLLEWAGLSAEVHSVTLISCFLFLGTMGKSAQMPFHVWLPFAMEAPTPVSALNYAATVVNAGPFLLVRLSPLLVLSPVAMACMAVVGAGTALYAAVVSMTQSDIKKILAYSTISQVGFMIMACGIGAFIAAIFHLLAHGFLKAFLFLSSGRALQSARSRSRVFSHQPISSRPPALIMSGAVVLACLPPFVIFSGPYEAVWAAHGFPLARPVFWLIGLVTVFFTGMYVFRGVYSLFRVGPGFQAQATDTSCLAEPQFFSLPHLIVLLAGGGIMAGVLVAVWTGLVQFLTPALAVSSSARPIELPAMAMAWWIAVPVSVAITGLVYAAYRQMRSQSGESPSSPFLKTAYVFFLSKGYVDEIYDVYLVQPILRLAQWLWQRIDVQGIDRLILGMATVAVGCAKWMWHMVDLKGIERLTVSLGRQSLGLGHWLWKRIDIRALEEVVGRIGTGTDAAGQSLQEVEPRTLQHHLLVMIFWLVLVIGLLYVLVTSGPNG